MYMLDIKSILPKTILREDRLISEAVTEELGISDKVTQIAERISNAVYENALSRPRKKVQSGIFENIFTFNIKDFGDAIKVVCHNMYFGDRNIYAKVRTEYSRRPNKYNSKTKTLDMHFDFVNNRIMGEYLYGAFQHELEHIFQGFMSNGNTKRYPSYGLAAKNINSSSKGIKTISEILYYSTAKELYAFANQAYQAIMHMDNIAEVYGDIRNAIADTNLYSGYRKLKRGMNFLTKNKDNPNFQNALQNFDITCNHIVKRCEWAVGEYAKYIGRVIVKCEKDLLNTEQ